MKTELNNVRWVDEFSVKIILTKQDIACLIEKGVLRDSIGYKDDKQMTIELTFRPEL